MTGPNPILRHRLITALAIACLALIAGCGTDLSQAEGTSSGPTEPTRTTEATGPASSTTSTSTSTTVAGRSSSTVPVPGAVTLPPGLTFPDGTEITLPDGVDLTIPDGFGNCLEAGSALTEFGLALLGVTTVEDVDRAVDTLEKAFGPASSNDIKIVADVAREAAEGDQLTPGAASEKAYSTAMENLTDRLAEVCGVG